MSERTKQIKNMLKHSTTIMPMVPVVVTIILMIIITMMKMTQQTPLVDVAKPLKILIFLQIP